MGRSGFCCALLALIAAAVYLEPAEACRFAELIPGFNAEGSHHGRQLLTYLPTNNTGKEAALAESAERGTATLESIEEYIKNALPVGIEDFLRPVGDFNSLQYYWGAFSEVSQYIPGAIVYTVKSIPQLLNDARIAVQTKAQGEMALANVDETYSMIFRALQANISALLGGLAIRLTFHDAGTYNPNNTYKGGANGSIRYEFDWPSNAGLQRFMWPIIWATKQELDRVLPQEVSYADLCAIAGAVGVFQTHGPFINVGYGRPDVDGPDPFQGVGSNTNQQRDYPIQEIINEWEFYGFTIDQLVTLTGAHSVGFSASTNPQGTISSIDRLFSNRYYKQIILGDAFFGSDKAFAHNNETLAVVEEYAADEELWFKTFSKEFIYLTWLGVNATYPRLGM